MQDILFQKTYGFQCKCSVGKRRRFFFFLKFFLHTCARSLFWSPFALLGRCIGYSVRFLCWLCAPQGTQLNFLGFGLAECLAWISLFLFLLSMITAICNVGCEMSTSEAAQTSSLRCLTIDFKALMSEDGRCSTWRPSL